MVLSSERSGAGQRVVLLHGFTQNARCWGAIPAILESTYEVVRPDAPGHGRSGHDDADLVAAAALLAEVGGRAHYVGYSMGGRTALHLALEFPELVRSLTLIGATAGLDRAEDRQARRRADEVIARRLDAAAAAQADGDLGPFTDFLTDWLATPLFASLPASSRALEARLTNRAGGLAASLRHCGTGTQEPLWSRLGQLAMPVAVVAGDRDPKFTALAHRLVDAIGDNATVRVEAGTHAVHLEDEYVIARALATVIGL